MAAVEEIGRNPCMLAAMVVLSRRDVVKLQDVILKVQADHSFLCQLKLVREIWAKYR